MAHLKVDIQDKTIGIQSHAFSCAFQDVGKNKKALFVFLRSLRSPETEKPLFTHETIAKAFGYADRRNIQNDVGEFERCGEDFQAFLSRTNTKRERLFGLIEEQVLQCPFLSPHQQYLALCDAHPDERVFAPTFRDYVRDLDGVSLLKRVQRLVSAETGCLDQSRYLQEVLEAQRLRNAKKKEIVATFPDVAVSSSALRGARFEGLSRSSWQKKLVVVLLYACTLPQDVLALVFGVGKTSSHNWIYEISSEDLEWQILREMIWWSGQVSFDEKWVKIKGQWYFVWYFVLCAVDAVSGFPLLIDLYPTLDPVKWTIFFRRFKAIYGVPTLIQCDGSQALAAARRLQTLAGSEVSSYIEAHILTPWRTLTLSLTTNASERFNRKIGKCFSARYGISSEDSARVLLRSLWLKELLLNGQQHLDATSQLKSLNVSRICQEHVDTGNILHFFHDSDPSQVEKFA